MHGGVSMNPSGILLVDVGLFSMAGDVPNWSKFMNTRRARLLFRLLGYYSVRAFYVLLGLE